MSLRTRLSGVHPLVAVAGLSLVALACLSPVHNDTWWHLAYGREMATRGGFAQIDYFSHTGYGRPFPNHQWLAERMFFALYQLGGLPVLTAFCAALLVTGWSLCWHLTRGALTDRLLVMAAAVAASTLVWSIRPQAFTVALLPATLTLLTRDRLHPLPLVMLAWANLHGGVLLGLVAVGVWTLTAVATRDARRWALLATLTASAAATLVTPLGLQYWPEILASLRRSQVHRLQEWQPPSGPPEHIFFWVVAAMLVGLTVPRWHQLACLADRALVATALVLLAPAFRSVRNIAPFMMVAGPSITVLLARGAAPSRPSTGRAGSFAMALATAGACAVVASAWTTPWSRLGWNPMSPEAAAAVRACPGPIYNSYAGGGPIIWMVPDQRVFVDSRQDHYPPGLVQAATDIENGADPSQLFSRFRVRCAAVPPASPVRVSLSDSGWHVTYSDSQWVVLVEPHASSLRTPQPK
jgi:hypothetical protein